MRGVFVFYCFWFIQYISTLMALKPKLLLNRSASDNLINSIYIFLRNKQQQNRNLSFKPKHFASRTLHSLEWKLSNPCVGSLVRVTFACAAGSRSSSLTFIFLPSPKRQTWPPAPSTPILTPTLQNEGRMRIQYKCLVLLYVFPEIKLRGLVISKT